MNLENNLMMFKMGIKKGVPVMIGFIPIATAFSVIALQSGLSVMETILMSAMLLAGASQFMAVNMLVTGAGSMEIIIATCIINIRHLIMSTYIMSHLKQVSHLFKLLLAFGITDETFGIMSMEAEQRNNPYFFAGLAIITYGSWVAGTCIGTIASTLIPADICMSLSIALYAMFIALLMPSVLKSAKIGLLVCISMFLNALFNKLLSPSWAIICSTLLGGFIGSHLLKGVSNDN